MSFSDFVASSLGRCSSLRHLHQLHAFLIPTGLHSDNLILARLIKACSALGHLLYANSIFSHAKRPNTYLYNTMIDVVSPSEAMFMYAGIFSSGLRPDTFSVPFVLKAVTELSAVEAGRQVHCQAMATGLCSDVSVGTALVRMYSLCGRVFYARKVFDETTSRDVAIWNAMVAGYAKAGDVDSAWKVFEDMPERNLISWTCVVSGFAQMKRPREAVMAFGRMLLENVEPDEVSMLAIVSACAHLGSLGLGKRLHSYILKHVFSRKLPLNNALIDMYAKSGSIRKARDVFESIEKKSVVTWTTMISGLAMHGLGRETTEVFSRMETALVKPNEITFIALLSACSHAGLVEIGRRYFNMMFPRYGVQPKIEHYGCIIDLLARAGYLEEARELVRAMPFQANAAIWGSLLCASNIHGDAKIAELALQNLMVLEPQNSGNYTLLSNIYASLGGWDEFGMLRKVMRDMGVKKTAGESSIEVNNRIRQFVAGDTSDSEFVSAFGIVRELFNVLKMAAHLKKEMIELLEYDE